LASALNTRAVLQYDHQVIAIGPERDVSCTSPCCDRMAAGYAFAVAPSIRPIRRSSALMNVASRAAMNLGS